MWAIDLDKEKEIGGSEPFSKRLGVEEFVLDRQLFLGG